MTNEKLIDPEKVHVRVNVWLENEKGEIVYGAGRQQILEAVAQDGTLSAAASDLGMSYRGLWGRIRISERRLGFQLLESHAGRGPNSGSSLTAHGKALMEIYGRLREALHRCADDTYAATLKRNTTNLE